MRRTHRIVVPLDFSDSSLRACDFAIAMTEKLDAELTLVEVLEPTPFFLPRDITDEGRAALQANLERHASLVRAYVPSVAARLVEGKPAEEIDRAVREVDADLVVMGTHGRRGVAHATLGSVAERVLRISGVPVVTVPGHAFPTRLAAARRLSDELAALRLEAPVFVALSREALPIAAALARSLSGSVDVWITVPIVVGDEVIGTLGEDGSVVMDPRRATQSEERPLAEAHAKETLRREVARLASRRVAHGLRDGGVVFVAESLVSPSELLAAANAVRPPGSRRVSVATPVASREVIRTAPREVEHFVFLEDVVLARPTSFYRHVTPVSDARARALLRTGADVPLVVTPATRSAT
jgi:nucleotide-binding universal stress UspA family protein